MYVVMVMVVVAGTHVNCKTMKTAKCLHPMEFLRVVTFILFS